MDEKTLAKLDELGVDFYSLRHYKLLKLFNIAGIEESEDIVDEMLSNDQYLEEYGLRQSIKQGSVIYFGKYSEDYGEFANKPIAWKVVDINNDEMLLISWFILDNLTMFNDQVISTWKNSYLRAWLNNTFLISCFTPSEREKILYTQLINEEEATSDKVFLFNEKMVNTYSSILKDCQSLQCSYQYNTWWLSSIKALKPDWSYSYNYYMTYASMTTAEVSNTSTDSARGVRPALRLSIKSKIFKPITIPRDNIISMHMAPILFGSYPQGESEDVISPIEWIIISATSSYVKLMSKYVLDWKPFNTKMKSKDKQVWIGSLLEKWLNEEFLYKAFSEHERSLILKNDSGLTDDTYDEFCPDYAVPDAVPRHTHVEDLVHVMCPSYDECPGIGTYKNRKHGENHGYFSRWEPKNDIKGTGDSIAFPTQLAISHGAPSEGSCKYWLRSLGSFGGNEAIADEEGWLNALEFDSYAGVRPVITLDLTTDVLKYIRNNSILTSHSIYKRWPI
ncbi:DUF6273 domain-containing protein [Aristaeella lactis]|uniref:Uncharacterized protein n=1 Tax=Aristaeella lactis TaxID=3046383 RepID=A0AC61PLH1_9FIRM|nr:DUF6273 domain-containing protein [Aristaeella lactis]QUA54669.1 hypothetical protein JYE50_15560 [Aristaeella lactis]SMC63540.1 hypothetical protein SAMN06297397_1688 [Aristaeella lactis]